jgi:hypothetical protein
MVAVSTQVMSAAAVAVPSRVEILKEAMKLLLCGDGVRKVSVN